MTRIVLKKTSAALCHTGAFGCIMVGRDEAGSPVAVKVALSRDDFSVEEARTNLLHEYLLQQDLHRRDPAHFAWVGDFGERFPAVPGADWAKPLAGMPYFVQEYLSGASLAAVIVNGAVLSLGEGKRLARSLVQAVATMESVGRAHNDIAPANIMMCFDGRIVLIDLGCASTFDPTAPLVRHEGYESAMRVGGTSPHSADSLFSIGMCVRDACFRDYLPEQAFSDRRAFARRSLAHLPSCDLAHWVASCLTGQFKTCGDAFVALG